MDSTIDQLSAAGLEIPGPLEFGRLVRCKVDGDKGGKQSGWYVLHEIRLDSGDIAIVGRFGNWKRFGGEALKIEFDKPSLTPAERQRIEAEQRALREQAEDEKKARAQEAASRAHRIWGKLPESGKSDYLTRKKVAAHGIRFSRGSIVVPVSNAAGLVGLQFIQGDGSKKFLTGTAKHGAWHLIGVVGADADVRLWIAEGYATAATVHQATAEPVVVAFDAGNLVAVAKAMRALYPQAWIVFAADNDAATEGNPGTTKAREAAAVVGGRVVAVAGDGFSDFNDLHAAKGLKAARKQLLDGFAAAAINIPADFSPAPPEYDIPPDAVDPGPLGPLHLVYSLTIENALERFALAMPDGKVWDGHARQLLKKTAARDLMGKKLFEQWVNHDKRRTVDQYTVKPMAAAAAAAGGGGLGKALQRYVYLYPSSDAWDKEKRQRVPLSALKHAIADCFDDWIKSDRRQEIDLERLVFDPTQQACPKSHINTFRGLPLTPLRDDDKCKAICELIAHLCNHNAEVNAWLLQWLAYPLQHVGAKLATAVLMHSSVQGSGKSLLFEEVIKPIYGEYASTLGQHQLESQYTDWRSQLLFGLFEEIFSRDQKYSHTGTLKHMITGKTQRIEKKFVSGWEESNYMNGAFLSNEVQPFPVETSDRRMLVIWPKQKMSADLKRRVLHEVRNGGAEAFYGLLLEMPMNGFTTHTEPPMTEEKERLIDFGRPAWEVFCMEWRAESLDVPYMPCLSDQLFAIYRRWCERRREHVVSQTKFGGFLSAQDGLSRRRDVHYDQGQCSRKGTFLVPREPRQEFAQRPEESQAAWLGRCAAKFEFFVSTNQPGPS